ncbi:hypothetical protein HYV73_01010 [Candidatus Uhrbacteria bacterium]|nr:hypothetical protein [Candidatus Uhrbacteria bacterium]
MRLRGIDFGPVWGASGVQGFFSGDEYFSHRWLRRLRLLDMKGMTFVAKTMTLYEQKGNMPRGKDLVSPREILPRCIAPSLWRAEALNAVGLSGPGAPFLLERGVWQKRKEPFFLSFMSIRQERDERLAELNSFVDVLASHLPAFQAPAGLQINFSCPNAPAHHGDQMELVTEVRQSLQIAGRLGIPLVPKLNVLVEPAAGLEMAQHPECDALCVSNTIPFGALADKIDWAPWLKAGKSPLERRGFGPGGLSGTQVYPLAFQWGCTFRSLPGGDEVRLNLGGGINGVREAVNLFALAPQADSIMVGSVAFLRSWRVRGIIRAAHAAAREQGRNK